MTIRPLLVGAATALLLAASAAAQTSAPANPATTPSQPDASAAPPSPAPDTSSSSSGSSSSGSSSSAGSSSGYNARASSSGDVTSLMKPGVTVKDSAGATIGKVSQVTTDSSGQPAGVVVKMGKNPITLPASSLTAQGNALMAQQSISELRSQSQSSPQ